MNNELIMKTARLAAKAAWTDVINPMGPDYKGNWHDDAFEAAVRAYMTVLANTVNEAQMSPPVQKAVEVNPIDRTPGEHFLAMCNGHYQGYTLTAGMLPDNVIRKMICYQPDPKSSVLYPLFISLMRQEMEHVTDAKGNPFLVAMSGTELLTIVK